MLPGDVALEGWEASDSLGGVGWAGEDKGMEPGHLPATWCQPTFSLPVHQPTGHQLAHCPQ